MNASHRGVSYDSVIPRPARAFAEDKCRWFHQCKTQLHWRIEACTGTKEGPNCVTHRLDLGRVASSLDIEKWAIPLSWNSKSAFRRLCETRKRPRTFVLFQSVRNANTANRLAHKKRNNKTRWITEPRGGIVGSAICGWGEGFLL